MRTSQKLIHKTLRVEGLEVFDLFSETNIACRDSEFLLDGDEDAALATAIKFGHDESC